LVIFGREEKIELGKEDMPKTKDSRPKAKKAVFSDAYIFKFNTFKIPLDNKLAVVVYYC
jgi:hypothetical protein